MVYTCTEHVYTVTVILADILILNKIVNMHTQYADMGTTNSNTTIFQASAQSVDPGSEMCSY